MMQSPLTHSFKAIALFTPGGDFAYCKDVEKQKHWHIHLCSALQEALNLPDAPHFLLNCYKATVDVYWDEQQQQFCATATAMPAVIQYRGLLNHLFEIPGTSWHVDTIQTELCDPQLLEQYRQEFPALWENHDLMIPVLQHSPIAPSQPTPSQPTPSQPAPNPSAPNPSALTQPASSTSFQEAATMLTLPLTTPLADTTLNRYLLRLFVAHHSPSNEAALRNLHRILERSHLQPYTLQVIDISKNPEQAERDQVTATPTLLRVQPSPARRIVGNLENEDQLLHLLVGLDSADYP